MRVLLALIAVALLAVPASAATSLQLGEADPPTPVDRGDRGASQPRAVPGEAIVRFERHASASDRRAARAAADVELDRSLPIPRAQVVEVEGSVAAAVRRLEAHPDVAYAQPNFRYRALAPPPNDTFFGQLWGLQDTPVPNPGVNALSAWDTTRGAGQVIAVLDTGVALDHPDIDLWESSPGGVNGHDFVDDDTVPDDYDFHGTHVAGTAAAIDDNGLGVAGVAPDAEVMAVRVLDGNGSGFTDGIAAGIEFAVTSGADVINMSLGGPVGAGDELMEDAIEIADAAGVVVVAAAGNEAVDNDANPTTPCTLPNPNLICVAAVTEAGSLAGFSNYGATQVDVAAPGTNILSAETDYATVFQNGLDVPTGWATGTANGGVPWGIVSSPRVEGTGAAADSPGGNYGQAIDEEQDAQSVLIRQAGIDLSGEAGCRMHFAMRYDLEEGFDVLRAGATDDLDDEFLEFTGSSQGFFFAEEVSISSFDGQPSVKPFFNLLSDELVELDGVYVDDVEVLCRDNTYSNAAPPTGNYLPLDGTSMATPHVSGVAALLKAADPSATDTEIVQAIKAGVLQLPALNCRLVTGGTVDAAAALAALSTGASPPDGCTGPPPPPPPPPPGPSQQQPGPIPPPPPGPQVSPPFLSLANSPSTARVSKRRVFRYRFQASPGAAGEATFRLRTRGRKAIGRASFDVSPLGRTTVRIRLSRKTFLSLRRKRKLVVNATVTIRNASGRSVTATRRLTLRPPRR